MIHKVQIINGTGTHSPSTVSRYGQLITGPVDYNKSVSVTLGTSATAVELIAPLPGHRIVIDGILLYANRNVSNTTEATVTLYSSDDGGASATQTSVIFNTELAKQTSRDFIGTNFLCIAGQWVNAITSDDDVFLTLLYYYVPVLEVP